MFYRVFSGNDTAVEPARLERFLHDQDITSHFRGDEQGWFQARLACPRWDHPLELQRYLASEEGIRGELNTWAAWLETQEDNPHSARLMAQVIASPQVFTLELPDDAEEEEWRLGRELCGYLARETQGVFQVDGQGFFTADGSLLVSEPGTCPGKTN